MKREPRPPAKQVAYTPRPRPVVQVSTLRDMLAGSMAEAPSIASATVEAKRHLGRVAGLRCVLCAALGRQQDGRTEAHHIREGQGAGQRAAHWLTAALCSTCHRGSRGMHGDRSLLRQAKCTELDLLAWTLEALAGPEAACATS